MNTTVQTHVGQVVWHDLMTGDVERAKAFYGELLGWELEVWKPGEMAYPMITANGQMNGGFKTLDPATGAPPHCLTYVRVGRRGGGAAERGTQAGGTVHVAPMDGPEVGRFAVIADPQGAVIAPFALGQEMTLPQGVFAWDELLTTDVEAAKTFYKTVFDWGNAAWEGDIPYTLFKSPEGQDVAGLMEKPPQAPSPHWLTYLVSDDVDGTVAKARTLGAEVYVEGMDIGDMGRIAVLGDPTGAAFGLFQAAGQ